MVCGARIPLCCTIWNCGNFSRFVEAVGFEEDSVGGSDGSCLLVSLVFSFVCLSSSGVSLARTALSSSQQRSCLFHRGTSHFVVVTLVYVA